MTYKTLNECLKRNLLDRTYFINENKFICYIHKDFYNEQLEYINSYMHDSNPSYDSGETYEFYLNINDSLFHELQKLQFTKNRKIRQTVRNDYHWEVEYEKGTLFIPHQLSQNLTVKDSPIIFRKGDEVEIILKNKVDTYERYMLRYIREAHIRSHENKGCILFHAGGVALDNKGIMIIGVKGAGKTTLMCHLLNAEQKFNYLGNDRVLLSSANKIKYVPLSIRITPKTISSFKKIEAYIDHNTQGLSRKNMPVEVISENEEKLEFTPREIGRIFERKLISVADLSAIVIPEFSLEQKEVTIEMLRAEDVKMNALKSCCFTPKDERWKEPWLVKHNKSQSTLEKECRDYLNNLTKLLPFFRISYGPYADSRVIGEKISQLLS